MAKQKKKRSKAYRGQDASVTRPNIVKVQAVSRSRTSQWWHDKKRIVKPVLITALVVGVIVWLLIELVRLILR